MKIKYPELIGAIHIVFRLAKGATITDRETATHFCSVKVNGEDANLYIHDNDLDYLKIKDKKCYDEY